MAKTAGKTKRFMEWYDFGYGVGFEVQKKIVSVKSPYQRIEIYETRNFGKLLAIDGRVQLIERFEPMYHEALVHPAMLLHDMPRHVLVIGGGDGGAVREALKHDVERCTLVEIDKKVIECCKKYVKIDQGALCDERVEIIAEDGWKFIRRCGPYDVIIIDSTDPVGAALPLFELEFYMLCAKKAPVIATQAGPLLFEHNKALSIKKDVGKAFGCSRLYSYSVVGYAQPWAFVLGWKGKKSMRYHRLEKIKTHYLDAENIDCLFFLPRFLKAEENKNNF